MVRRSKRLVLFLPRRNDPARGEEVHADLLPLELLQIASGPAAEGYEIVLVDAMIHDRYLERVLEACDGALLFASSAILGYQVLDGYLVARAVRERFPRLPIVQGGWFPSVVPELYLASGVADAVGLGQGELTFLDLVHAIESGADLEGVEGLALLRDGALHRTAPRAVVGFDRFHPVPWHLLEYERYVERQLAPRAHKVRHVMSLGARWKRSTPPRGFSLFSSFGCPTACTFCCSPLVTGRRWKAIPGDALAEQVAELQERFRFDVVRFQDANWGVAEKRTRDFCAGLERRGVRVFWNATIEIETVTRYADATLDALGAAGCYLLWLGAESGTREMQERIKKHIEIEHIPSSIARLAERGITPGTFWIIGFPGESEESMLATLREAARVKRLFPGAGSDVYPFRAIPGTEDFARALELGWSAPSTFEEWGQCFEWKWNNHHTPIPPRVRHRWERYTQTAAIYDGNVREGPRALRRWLARAAGWRLAREAYGWPLEQKLYDGYVRLTGQRTPGADA